MKKIVIFNLMLCALLMAGCKDKVEVEDKNYIDLGLSSGTLWKSMNENVAGEYFLHDGADNLFGDEMPTKEQFLELINECSWEWVGMGCKIIGPNKNYITLPAMGAEDSGLLDGVGTYGFYWIYSFSGAFAFGFRGVNNQIEGLRIDEVKEINRYGFTVRLVKSK